MWRRLVLFQQMLTAIWDVAEWDFLMFSPMTATTLWKLNYLATRLHKAVFILLLDFLLTIWWQVAVLLLWLCVLLVFIYLCIFLRFAPRLSSRQISNNARYIFNSDRGNCNKEEHKFLTLFYDSHQKCLPLSSGIIKNCVRIWKTGLWAKR